MKYAYAGPGPVETEIGLVKPGDEHEFDAPPSWGPWNVVIEPKPDVPPPSTPPPPPPVSNTPPAASSTEGN